MVDGKSVKKRHPHGAGRAAVPGSDKQQQLVVAYAPSRGIPTTTHPAAGHPRRSVVVPGLSVDQDLRWALLTQIAASGGAYEDDIAAELDRDPSLAGREQALKARAAIPTAQAKTAAWALAIEQDTQTNAALEAARRQFRLL